MLFAAGVKAKHPEYKDVDNNELVGAMIEKYPQYADQVEYYPSKKKILRNLLPLRLENLQTWHLNHRWSQGLLMESWHPLRHKR